MRIGMSVLYTAYNNAMNYTTFFFDLDETIYPPNSGLWEAIRERINAYLHARIGIPQEQVASLREKYFKEYGTTLRGLQANYEVDTDEYLAFVHNVPIGRYIHPDPGLRMALAGIRARKFIFTNADANHARRVLEATGLQGLFDGIIDVHTTAPHCKPMPGAFELALEATGNPEPHTCVLLDDQGRVTRAARQLGMYTILVGKNALGDEADASLLQLADLPTLLDGRA
jgi:putative hydrolase of the HAD superfamily